MRGAIFGLDGVVGAPGDHAGYPTLEGKQRISANEELALAA